MDTEKYTHHGMTLYECIKDNCPICERNKRIATLEAEKEHLLRVASANAMACASQVAHNKHLREAMSNYFAGGYNADEIFTLLDWAGEAALLPGRGDND